MYDVRCRLPRGHGEPHEGGEYRWVATESGAPTGEPNRPGQADAAALAALADLVAALPKCRDCGNPATRAHGRGGGRWCDEHGAGVPEYTRAQPLRRALQLLAGATPRRP